MAFHFLVLQPSGLLRLSQEAVSYFGHTSSPVCASILASEIPCFLLQTHFSSPPTRSCPRPNGSLEKPNHAVCPSKTTKKAFGAGLQGAPDLTLLVWSTDRHLAFLQMAGIRQQLPHAHLAISF